MKLFQNALLLAASALPLCAQAAPYDVRMELIAGDELTISLRNGDVGTPFLGVILAATKDTRLEIPGLPPLLAFEAIVATAVAIDDATFQFGVVKLPYDVYLQGVTLTENWVGASEVFTLPAAR
jgi:hypothetical protein